MNLIDAAQAIERLHNSSVLDGDRRALWMARNALLVIVSEGFDTLDARLKERRAEPVTAGAPINRPTPVRAQVRKLEKTTAGQRTQRAGAAVQKLRKAG